MMPSTRASMSRGRWRAPNETAKPQPASIRLHNSTEPSWLPHTALNLKYHGNWLFELLAM